MQDYNKRFYIWAVIVLIVISSSFFLQYRNNNNLLENNAKHMTETSVDVLNEEINNWLNNKGQLINDAKHYIEMGDHTDEEILKYLEVLLTENEEFFSIYYGAKDNTMINASGWEMPEGFDLRERPWYKKTVKQDQLIYTNSFINASEDDIIITVAVPVYNKAENELLGVIAGDVSISTIISYVKEQQVAEKGFFILIDNENRILAHPDFDYNLNNGLPTINKKFGENSQINQFEINETKKVKLNDKEGFFSYKRVKNTQWHLANFTPLEYYTDSFSQLLKSFLFAFLLSILVILTFFWLQNKYVIKPLIRFDSNINNIDLEKNLDYRLPISTNNDFKFLSESINDVLEKTQNYFQKLKASEEKLKMEKEKLRTTLDSIGDAVISTDMEGKIVRMNSVAERLTGWKLKDVIGKPIEKVFNIVNAKTRKKVENPANKVLEEKKVVGLANHTVLIAKDGSEYQIADSGAPIINDKDNITGVVLVFRDVTKKYEMQEKLKKSEKKHRQLFENMTNGLALHEMIYNDEKDPVDYRFLDINHAFEKLTGLSASNLIGNTVKEVLPKTEQYWIDNYGKVATTGESISFEEYAQEQDSYYMVRAFSPEPGKFATIISDITKSKKAEEQLQYKTFHDELTGLYNRAYFNEEIKRYDNKRQLPLSIIMGDVNGLKIANDSFGHKEGDKLLKRIAQIIKKSCRQEDLVVRIGGDEFVVLLPQTSKEETEEIYARIKDACQKAKKGPIETSIALGIATKKEITDDFEKVLKSAEDKMYQNKVHESKSVHNTIIDSLETMLRETTNETLEHSQRLRDLAVGLGKELDLSPHELDVLASLANLHDLGKIAISKDILQKPGSLNDKEWEEIKRHPEAGYKIAKSSPKLNDVAEGIYCHHERWDGDGYPQGLKGEEIPLLARIITIVDAYDVMTNSRPYKEPMRKEDALEEIERCSGSQFDPDLASLFIEMMLEN